MAVSEAEKEALVAFKITIQPKQKACATKWEEAITSRADHVSKTCEFLAFCLELALQIKKSSEQRDLCRRYAKQIKRGFNDRTLDGALAVKVLNPPFGDGDDQTKLESFYGRIVENAAIAKKTKATLEKWVIKLGGIDAAYRWRADGIVKPSLSITDVKDLFNRLDPIVSFECPEDFVLKEGDEAAAVVRVEGDRLIILSVDQKVGVTNTVKRSAVAREVDDAQARELEATSEGEQVVSPQGDGEELRPNV